METKLISDKEAFQIAATAESHFFDRKAAAIKGAKLQRVVVAFANADGGEVLIGIADDADQPDPAKRWQGAKLIEDFNQHIQALTEVDPTLSYDLSFLKADTEAPAEKVIEPALLASVTHNGLRSQGAGHRMVLIEHSRSKDRLRRERGGVSLQKHAIARRRLSGSYSEPYDLDDKYCNGWPWSAKVRHSTSGVAQEGKS